MLAFSFGFSFLETLECVCVSEGRAVDGRYLVFPGSPGKEVSTALGKCGLNE